MLPAQAHDWKIRECVYIGDLLGLRVCDTARARGVLARVVAYLPSARVCASRAEVRVCVPCVCERARGELCLVPYCESRGALRVVSSVA